MRLFIQEAAERDILSQIEWYASQGLSDIARRFQASVLAAIDALSNMPNAGTSRPSRNRYSQGSAHGPCGASENTMSTIRLSQSF